jgi:transcriptional regulator with XRE-family HTH domain
LYTLSKGAGISPSYLSDFERGFKLPTSKYLKYLHKNHNIDLNYIFGTEGPMLRPKAEKDVKPDFGKYAEEIEELLYYLSRLPHAMYAVLGFFTEYKLKNKHLIKGFNEELEERGESVEKLAS